MGCMVSCFARRDSGADRLVDPDFQMPTPPVKGLFDDFDPTVFGMLNPTNPDWKPTYASDDKSAARHIYASMESYCNEMSHKLLGEEKAQLGADHNMFLTNDDFSLKWQPKNGFRPCRGLGLVILMTPEFIDRFVSPMWQELGLSPFFKDQTMVLLIGDETPLFGFVSNAYVQKRSRDLLMDEGIPNTLRMTIQIYEWDHTPLPDAAALRKLQILRLSVGISRALKAMSNTNNPIVKEMLLGQSVVARKSLKSEIKFSNFPFNESQKEAINSVMVNPVTILQGPPGTGKTCTIIEIILQLLKLEIYPILVVAASNTAVDNIAEKLMREHEEHILRIVSGAKEGNYGDDHFLAPICLHKKVYDAMSEDIQALMDTMNEHSVLLTATEHKRMMKARNPFSNKTVANSKIILTTNVVAGGAQFKNVARMPAVIMDEATQSEEYSNLIPLSFCDTEKIVLVGDQRQLNGHAESSDLAVSLFERIIANGTYEPEIMLDTQYRMHPRISEFPRNQVYQGLLKNGINAADRQMEGIPANPVLFWDTQGRHRECYAVEVYADEKKYTYCNLGEAKLVEEVLTYLILKKHIDRARIAVISPYGGQRSVISSAVLQNKLICLDQTEVHVETDRDMTGKSKPMTIHTVSGIKIASIDAFQGREKDFIVISCVRSNEENTIGFLSDARRLNVALTRARYGLILIGDVQCLKQGDALWKSYIDYLELMGCVLRNSRFKYG